MGNATGWRRRMWIAAIAIFVASLILRLLKYRWRIQWEEPAARVRRQTSVAQATDPRIQGLSEAEAAARRSPDQDIQFGATHSRGEIWRYNIFSIFNLTLLGLVIAQLLLNKPYDALISAGVMFLNIGLNGFQELYARKQLDQLVLLTRPQATVIREGNVGSIDPPEVVVGDVLVVGPGDWILADGEVVSGQIVVDESMLTDESRRHTRRAGDRVYTGSSCVTGHAAYEVKKVGDARLIASHAASVQDSKNELTPLQRIIDLILRILLVIVAFFSILLLAQYFVLGGDILSDAYKDAVGIIFSVAPPGLFFMILVSYAIGTANMSRLGALVLRPQSVESLAQVTVLCFGKTGILTGIQVQLDYMDPPPGHEGLAEHRVRHILGNYAHSTAISNAFLKALADAFPGHRRAASEEAPFLAAYGWSAITFNDVDLRGTYVLGEPETLEPRAAADIAPPGHEEEQDATPPAVWSRVLSRVNGFFKRSNQASDNPIADDSRGDQPAQPSAGQLGRSALQDAGRQQIRTADTPAAEDTPQPTFFARLWSGVGHRFRRSEDALEKPPGEEPASEKPALLFAYRPDVVPLHDSSGTPQLPGDLIPLCYLRFTRMMRPKARETVRAFSEAGVEGKILSSDDPDRLADVARQLGLGGSAGTPWRVISGPDLAVMDEAQFARAAREAIVFGQLTPEQKGEVIRKLREQGRYVAMVGDGVDDVLALREANLGVVMRSASQAALNVADIVLLRDRLRDLAEVLRQGQRIVNNILDILKLNLAQVSYLLLFILVVSVARTDFPYAPAHGSIITFVTLAIPSIALSLRAPAGALSGGSIAGQLAHFVPPAAILTGASALAVHLILLQTGREVAHAQLAVTYTLVATGLLLVIFVRPPSEAWVGGNVLSGDWRPSLVAIVLFLLFLLFSRSWLAVRFFNLTPLPRPVDYLIVGGVAVVWAFVLRYAWRARLIERYLRVDFGAHQELSGP